LLEELPRLGGDNGAAGTWIDSKEAPARAGELLHRVGNRAQDRQVL
jgi:hypothetical protein